MNELEKYLSNLADTIREKRNIDVKIKATNFGNEILKILDVFSTMGIIYAIQKDSLTINKLQIGSYKKKKFNGIEYSNSIIPFVMKNKNTDYVLKENSIDLNLEVIEDESL